MQWRGLLRKIPRRVPRPWLVVTLASLFAVYLLLGAFALPRYIQGAIPEFVEKELKRKASIGEVRFNPLLFKLELRDFELAEADERPIAGFRYLLVDFELSSLLRWAWTFSSIVLDGLELRPDIAPDGRFNFAALADSLPKGEAKSDAPPPRLVLQHFELTDAAVTFSDRSGARPRFDTLRPLALELRDLTTLPDRRGPYNVTARLPGGGTLAWRGEMSLRPIFSFGEVALKGGKPATVWRFFQDRLMLDEPAGEVDIGLRYRAAYTDGTPELTVEDIRITASGTALALKGAKEPFLELKTASVTGARFDLAQRELRVPSIELRGGVVRAETRANGVLDLQDLAGDSDAAAASPPASAPGLPWRIRLDSVRVADVAVRYRDMSRAMPLAAGIGTWESGLSAALDLGAGEPRVTVDNIAITLSRVTAGAATAAEPLIGLNAVLLEAGRFELHEQHVAARRIAIKGGSVQVLREQDGRMTLVEVLKEGEGTKRRKELQAALQQARTAGEPWHFALDAFDIEGLKIALAAQGFGQPVAYDIDPLALSVKNIRNEGKTPITLEAALRVAQGGSLKLSAETNTAGTRASARATLQGLSLRPLQPVFSSRTAVVLNSGEVSTTLQAQYRGLKERDEVRVGGSASLDNLQLAETGSGERFLEWKSVTASGIAFSLAPDRLVIADVVARGLGAKVLVNKDRSVNLAQAFTPPGGTKTETSNSAASDKTQAEFPVAIERVRMENGAVDFSDLSLVLPFAAKIQELEGSVQGLSTDRASRAVAKLEGRVDEFGLARVDGSLATADPTEFMDLRVAFRNIEMSPLSAYSVTFAGRRIAAGRLGLDLQYKIDKGALLGDNKVELMKFTLGERVEAPGALNLPLDLAVALLTDAEGRIAIGMPVTGNVNDPQFNYGHLVWQAITTVLTNIVSAPFRALFGAGGDTVESIAFDAGRAALLPPEREKLKRVAEALEKRPQLKLLVEGQYSDADGAALRRRDVARALAAELESEAAGEEPPPVNTHDAKTQRAMETLFVKRASEQALAEFIAQTEKARGKPVERVGAISAMVGRASDDGAFYDALLERLNATAPLPGDALDKLALARSAAVAEHLEKTLSVPPARVEGKSPAAADGERVKLGLDAAAPKPL